MKLCFYFASDNIKYLMIAPPEEKFVHFKDKFINLVHFESSKLSD